MTKRPLTLILLLYALAGACIGGDNVVGLKPPPPKSVLTKLEVTPGTGRLLQGDVQSLTIKAWDQFGTSLLDDAQSWELAKVAFVSSDSAIASVTRGGTVIGVAPGVATITVSLTIGGSTLTGSMIATVDPVTDTSVVLTTDQYGQWTPSEVSLKAPATVTWVVPDGVQAPTTWLNVWDENAEKLQFINGVATRTFSTPGYYYYGTGGGLMWDEEGGVVRVF